MTPIGRMVLEPQSRQLLRRDRAGRVLHGAHRARARLLQRSAARRPHPFLRRHADLAARRAQLPRDPDQRPGRAGRTTTSATACIGRPFHGVVSPTSRTRSAAAVPFQAGARGFMSFPAAHRRRQGPRQAGEIRRALQPGDAVLEQPDRRREGAHRRARSASSSPRCRRRPCAGASWPCCATSPKSSPRAVAEGLGMPLPEAAAARPAARAAARSRRVGSAFADGASRATAASRPAASRSSWTTGSTTPRLRHTALCSREARYRDSSAPVSAPSRPRKELPSRRKSRWKPARRWFTTLWYCQRRCRREARRKWRGGGIREGHVSPLQGDSRLGGRAGDPRQGGHPRGVA